MIKAIRVDDRLLHGQVITKWVTTYDPDAIVIADDETANNAIAKMALKVAKPEGIKLSIREVDDAINLLKNPKTQKMNIFVLVKTTDTVCRIVDSGLEVGCVNIGGIRSFDKNAKELTGVVKVTDNDIKNIRVFLNKVKDVDIRTVPSEKNVDVLDLINNL